jgi:glucose-6-phosphate 1-dehydrogenase
MQAIDLVVFGASGDLSQRKLFPALFQLFIDHHLPEPVRIIAITRSKITRKVFLKAITPMCQQRQDCQTLLAEFFSKIILLQVELDQPEQLQQLQHTLRVDACWIYYFAVPPQAYAPLVQGLMQHDCINSNSRVVVEKPIGQDALSAAAIQNCLSRAFDESQIFRIDHYLGKETVQNIMALRFGNAILEPLWRAERIDYMQITVAEELGVENRGGYYDRSGALRDMVQNHLLQLLCICTMEPPAQLTAYAVRDEKLKVLSALRPITPMDVVHKTVRGQYRAAPVGKNQSQLKNNVSYVEEPDVNPLSTTETFAAIKVEIDNWRWAGMPIYLRTGKKMQRQHSEIVIQFKEVPHKLFRHSPSNLLSNRLVITLQPEEKIRLFLNTKAPGRGMSLDPVALNLDMKDTTNHTNKHRRWDAYERLIVDILQGDLTLFMREKEVAEAWRWVDPIIQGWQQWMPTPEPYISGSWGPVAADQLLARDGHIWHNPV